MLFLVELLGEFAVVVVVVVVVGGGGVVVVVVVDDGQWSQLYPVSFTEIIYIFIYSCT